MADDTLYFDIAKALIDQISASWSTLPVVLDNDDAEGVDISNGFVRVSVPYYDSRFASINANNPKVRTRGVFVCEIFTGQNEQIGTGLQYAGDIARILRGKSFSNVTCYAPTIEASYETKYGKSKYWLTMLHCPFLSETHVTIL